MLQQAAGNEARERRTYQEMSLGRWVHHVKATLSIEPRARLMALPLNLLLAKTG